MADHRIIDDDIHAIVERATVADMDRTFAEAKAALREAKDGLSLEAVKATYRGGVFIGAFLKGLLDQGVEREVATLFAQQYADIFFEQVRMGAEIAKVIDRE